MEHDVRNPFRSAASRNTLTYESSDLQDDQLDRFSGGIPRYNDPDREEYLPVRPELPLLATRPSDDPDLWF